MPYVAVSTGLYQNNLRVFRHDIAGWTELGVPGVTSACAQHKTIALALELGTPHVTSFGTACGYGIDYFWLPGATWQSHPSTTYYPAQLAMYANGSSDVIVTDQPYVAMSEYGYHWLRYWDGGANAWVNLGSSLDVNDNTGYNEDIAITADASGQLFAAWMETSWSSLSEIWVKTYGVAGWSAVGGKVSGFSYANSPSIAIVEGSPWVAYIENVSGANQVWVREWTGTNWDLVGGALSSPNIAGGAPVIVGAALPTSFGPRAHVAYREPYGSGLEHLYVKVMQ